MLRRRGTTRARIALWAACVAACLPGCGGADGLGELGVGTVAVLNTSDQGMAPLVITEFYLSVAGSGVPGPNRLAQPVQPGGVVILGPFPAGLYDAVAVLQVGGNVVFMDREVRAGEPTNFVIPAP